MKPKRPPQGWRLMVSIALAEKRTAQAEFIGWPALAESFRRELAALLAQLPAKDRP